MRTAGQLLRGWGPIATSTPTLAIADNADGTGATATITGAATGATVEVFTVAVDDDFSSQTAVSGGSRSGNGTVSLDLDPGPYWAFAVATLGGASAVSNIVYFFATTGDDATHQRILEAVQSTIRNLSLSGIDSANVLVRATPWDRNLTKPCVVIAPLQEQMPANEGTNTKDQIGYGVIVTFAKATNEDVTTSRNAFLEWRRRAAAAFRNQRLSGVSEVYRCTIEPLPVLLGSAFDKGLDLGGFVIRALAYEARGL